MRIVDLSYRSEETEIMDNLSDDSPALFQALKELDIINQWLGGNAITINAVKKLILREPTKLWRIADLGCGSGEMLLKIAKWAKQKGIKVQFYGFDANPNVTKYAIEHCKDFPEIEIHTENIFSNEFSERKFDILLCTLFLHHFSEKQLNILLKQFKKQSEKVIINDLHRHWFAYYSIKWLTKVFSKSPMVQNDACLSVWRAFSQTDLKYILHKAEIHEYQLKWRWAFRWKLII